MFWLPWNHIINIHLKCVVFVWCVDLHFLSIHWADNTQKSFSTIQVIAHTCTQTNKKLFCSINEISNLIREEVKTEFAVHINCKCIANIKNWLSNESIMCRNAIEIEREKKKIENKNSNKIITSQESTENKMTTWNYMQQWNINMTLPYWILTWLSFYVCTDVLHCKFDINYDVLELEHVQQLAMMWLFFFFIILIRIVFNVHWSLNRILIKHFTAIYFIARSFTLSLSLSCQFLWIEIAERKKNNPQCTQSILFLDGYFFVVVALIVTVSIGINVPKTEAAASCIWSNAC